MRKLILVLFSLSLTVFCFANGRCEKLEKEILKNPNVLSVDVGQIDKWTEEIYFAHIILSNGILLEVREFNRDLSGKMISVERIGDCEFPYCTYAMKVPDKHGLNSAYLYTSIKTFQLSCLLKKKIITVDDIINNSDEIYAFAEMLSRESPEERTIRRNLGTTQNDPNFTGKLGNFETDEYWGQVFARAYSEDFWNTNPGDYWEGMFADEQL